MTETNSPIERSTLAAMQSANGQPLTGSHAMETMLRSRIYEVKPRN